MLQYTVANEQFLDHAFSYGLKATVFREGAIKSAGFLKFYHFSCLRINFLIIYRFKTEPSPSLVDTIILIFKAISPKIILAVKCNRQGGFAVRCVIGFKGHNVQMRFGRVTAVADFSNFLSNLNSFAFFNNN